jgi:hypothetical protein
VAILADYASTSYFAKPLIWDPYNLYCADGWVAQEERFDLDRVDVLSPHLQ